MHWHTQRRIRDAQGQIEAEIQSRGEPIGETEAPGNDEVTTTRLSAFRRVGRHAVLENPFAKVRIVARSERMRAFIGRCTGCALPEHETERGVAAIASAHGLLAPCAHGLAPSRHDEPDPQPGWDYAEAALWAAFALKETDASEPWGMTWEGARYEGLPGLLADDERGERDEIPLECRSTIARAVPASAQRFAAANTSQEALSRWLARFARVRERGRHSDWDEDYEFVRRGMPEAGGLGALRLWLAIERVEGLEGGMYRYDAIRHSLVRVSGRHRTFVDDAEQSTESLFGRPAGVIVLSARMERINAKYSRIGLALALQSAGACIAAATVAGADEQIAVRGNGSIAAQAWLEVTGLDPSRECPIGMLSFGAQG